MTHTHHRQITTLGIRTANARLAAPRAQFANKQRGITLIVVMVMLLLAGLLVLGGSRVSLLNEKVTGNSMDYQRAFDAAEATRKDAELDIACLGTCNNRAGATIIPCDQNQIDDFLAAVSVLDPPCIDGLCADLGDLVNGNPATSFWSPDPAVRRMDEFNAVGATYGQFTNAQPLADTALSPILLANQARYWIEILRYGAQAGGGRSVGSEAATGVHPDGCPAVYRITSVATGLRANTTSVVQSWGYLAEP